MNRNKRILQSAIIFMVFTMISIPLRSKAYWSHGITNQSSQLNSTVNVGYWNQVFNWDSTTTYGIGSRVIYNGVTYKARKQNSNVIPGVSPGWKSDWKVIL